MRRIRVVIVEDSAVTRRLLATLLDRADDFEVLDAVEDGERAVERVAALRPDAVTMDLHLPGIDGLEATRRIMRRAPTPILIVSASTNVNDRLIYEAMRAGAVAVVQRPLPPGDPRYLQRRRRLLDALRTIAPLDLAAPAAAPRVASATRPPRKPAVAASPPLARPARSPSTAVRLIAVAASTGGPAALQRMLGDLPKRRVPPIAVVQHISDGFVDGLADWLAAVSRRDVRVALDGEVLEPGAVRVAPDGRHLVVLPGGRVALRRGPAVDGHRPSASVLYRSVAKVFGPAALGVVLTGMGRDGAAGLLELHETGAVTLAQDAASSVVYGMPAAAVEVGAIDEVVPLSELGSTVGRLLVGAGDGR